MTEKKKRLKGSDKYLITMFAGWIGYIVFDSAYFHFHEVWLPDTLTAGTVLLFLYETFCLYKLAKTEETGNDPRNKLSGATNAVKTFVSSKIGLAEPVNLDDEITETIERVNNGKETDLS